MRPLVGEHRRDHGGLYAALPQGRPTRTGYGGLWPRSLYPGRPMADGSWPSTSPAGCGRTPTPHHSGSCVTPTAGQGSAHFRSRMAVLDRLRTRTRAAARRPPGPPPAGSTSADPCQNALAPRPAQAGPAAATSHQGSAAPARQRVRLRQPETWGTPEPPPRHRHPPLRHRPRLVLEPASPQAHPPLVLGHGQPPPPIVEGTVICLDIDHRPPGPHRSRSGCSGRAPAQTQRTPTGSGRDTCGASTSSRVPMARERTMTNTEWQARRSSPPRARSPGTGGCGGGVVARAASPARWSPATLRRPGRRRLVLPVPCSDCPPVSSSSTGPSPSGR